MSLSPSLVILGSDSIRAAAVALYDAAGNQLSGFDSSRPANAGLTTVPVTNMSAVLLAANAARRTAVIYNDSGKTLYVAFAATATTAAYTYPVPSHSTLELPLNGYTGVISGILPSGSGNAVVTEVTT